MARSDADLYQGYCHTAGGFLAFPAGEGGPLAVDEENTAYDTRLLGEDFFATSFTMYA